MNEKQLIKETSNLPWYKEGLRFQCTECGKCCTGASGFVWVSIEEITAMAVQLQISSDLFKRKYIRRRNNRFALTEKKISESEFACVFLQGKQCLVYQSRPVQCRTFPWWKENLNTKESWELAAQDCEGIHQQAPIVPYEQIERLVQIHSQTKTSLKQ